MIKKIKRWMSKPVATDRLIFKIGMATFALCYIGLVMVASTGIGSFDKAGVYRHSTAFQKQAMFMILGLMGAICLSKMKISFIYKMTPAFYGLGIVLILLLLSPLGKTEGGATRWLGLNTGPRLQVAEVIKIAVVFWVARMLHKYPQRKKSVLFVLRVWILGGLPAILLLKISNDLSSSLVVLAIVFVLSFTYTECPKIHVAAILIAVLVVTITVNNVAKNMPEPDDPNISFRTYRIAAWIDPVRYSDNKAFQTIQAKTTIQSGGLFGRGFGESLQKYDMLPEADTDFIFSIVCEEFGAVGAVALLSLYGFLLLNLIKVSLRAKIIFESAACLGIFTHILVQLLINLFVNLGIFPNTGLPLPFISNGGTSVCLLLMELGTIIGIEKRNEKRAQKNKENMKWQKNYYFG